MYDSSLEKTWSRKLANRWMGPYKVLKRLDGGAYLLAELDGSRLRDPIAGARLKIFRSRGTLGEETKRKGKEVVDMKVTMTHEKGETSKQGASSRPSKKGYKVRKPALPKTPKKKKRPREEDGDADRLRKCRLNERRNASKKALRVAREREERKRKRERHEKRKRRQRRT